MAGMRTLVRRLLKSQWTQLGLGLVLAAGCAVAVAATVRHASDAAVAGVRLGGSSAETRIVVDLRGAASGQIDQGDTNPTELALVLSRAAAPPDLAGRGLGLVRDWKVVGDGAGARLVLDLTQAVTVERRFLLPPTDGALGWRYVIDIAARGPVVAHASPATHEVRQTVFVAPTPVMQMAAAIAPAPSHERKVVVIDPGHGGRDSGAVGASSFEKNVTLATALALRDRLERSGRYQVVMTRATDVYVPLEQRVQIARRAGADLFISLHADSGGADHGIHGATVYTLSERGEQRVGYVLRGNEWFLQQASNDQAVGQILLDLTERSTRNRSAEFAQMLIGAVGDRAPLLDRSQRDANYFVLLAPDVPAALLEMGFITNSADEARLNDPDQRAALADKIAQSIDAYFAGTDRPRLAER